MSIYSQHVSLPIIFHIEEGAINKVSAILNSKNFQFRKLLVITGGSYSLEILKTSNIHYASNYCVQSNTIAEVHSVCESINRLKYDLIIALGGGKIIDFSKRASLITNVNLIVIPTIVSNDGLMSPISVLVNDRGFTESMPGAMPLGIIIDTEILFSAPDKYFQAAAGDILSNVSATNDWLIASREINEKVNDLGFHLSRMSAFATISYNNTVFRDYGFKRLIVECQLNSGIAMSLSGSSRPCSGSEHLISHALDYLKYDMGNLHGYKVGCLSLFSLFLQDKLTHEIIQYSLKIGLNPLYIIEVLDFFKSDHPDLDIVEMFKSMRQNRYTVIDKLNQIDLYERSDRYIQFLKESGIG